MSQIKTKFIANSAVTNPKLANMVNNTVKANISGGTAAPSDVSAVSTATVSSFMVRDTNANVQINTIVENFATTATAAGTTTLTVSSAPLQQFTGATTQTVVLPNATTLVNGWQFQIFNRSSGAVTVNANGGGLLQTMAAATQAIFTLVSNGTSAGTWDVSYTGAPSGSVTYRAGQQTILTTYTFTVTSANATVGATYTNNGQTFTVLATIAAQTTLLMSGTGAPTASGTLTKATGTGDATIAFSTSTNASATTQVINFSSTLGTTAYAISVVMENTTDANPQFQEVEIISKSAIGFVVRWNAPVDSANYSLEYTAILNA